MDVLTVSSVNSGNSFKYSRKTVTSSANWDICTGKSSGLRLSGLITGVLTYGGGFGRPRFVPKDELFDWEEASSW